MNSTLKKTVRFIKVFSLKNVSVFICINLFFCALNCNSKTESAQKVMRNCPPLHLRPILYPGVLSMDIWVKLSHHLPVCKTRHNYGDWIIDTRGRRIQIHRHKTTDMQILIHGHKTCIQVKAFVLGVYIINSFMQHIQIQIPSTHRYTFWWTWFDSLCLSWSWLYLTALRWSLCVISLRSLPQALPWWTRDNFPVSPPLIFIDRVLIIRSRPEHFGQISRGLASEQPPRFLSKLSLNWAKSIYIKIYLKKRNKGRIHRSFFQPLLYCL